RLIRSPPGRGSAFGRPGPAAIVARAILARRRLAISTADVRVAIDPAPTPAAVSLAIHRGLVGRPAPAGPATALAAPASALFGDQVLGDLGLVEVLVLIDRSRRCRPCRRRRSELRIPDGPEGCRTRRPWRDVQVLVARARRGGLVPPGAIRARRRG